MSIREELLEQRELLHKEIARLEDMIEEINLRLDSEE